MFFRNKKKLKCAACNSFVDKKFSYCPHCGNSIIEKSEELRDYGLIGKTDVENMPMSPMNLGITDKIIGSLVNSLIKNFDKQMQEAVENQSPEIEQLPNGVRIKISQPIKKQKKAYKKITEEQLNKMASLPRSQAKTSIKRLSDKIIYELSTPGVESTEDILISKLESGYEIKAIGDKKIYVNSLPINLPLKSVSINGNTISVEFKSQ